MTYFSSYVHQAENTECKKDSGNEAVLDDLILSDESDDEHVSCHVLFFLAVVIFC